MIFNIIIFISFRISYHHSWMKVFLKGNFGVVRVMSLILRTLCQKLYYYQGVYQPLFLVLISYHGSIYVCLKCLPPINYLPYNEMGCWLPCLRPAFLTSSISSCMYKINLSLLHLPSVLIVSMYVPLIFSYISNPSQRE